MNSDFGSTRVASRREDRGLVVVPVPITNVPGNDRASILFRACEVFKPRYLVVPRTTAPHFEVVSFMIGKRSQLVPTDVPDDRSARAGISAEVFSGDVSTLGTCPTEFDFLREAKLDVPLPLALDVYTPDYLIHLVVRNVSANWQRFSAALYGYKIE